MSKLKKYNLCLTSIERGILGDLKERGIIVDYAEGTRQAIRDYGIQHGLKITDYQVIPA
jgi:hypothetical protein